MAMESARQKTLRAIAARGHRRKLALLRRYLAGHGWRAFRAGSGGTRYYGEPLGNWVSRLRSRYEAGTLPKWLRRELEQIPGWSWRPRRDQGDRKLGLLRAFVAEHGWTPFRPGSRAPVVEGVDLGTWLGSCRADYHKGRLSAYLTTELEAIPGWTWTVREEYHDQFLAELSALASEFADTGRDVLRDIVKLATWIDYVRALHAGDALDDDLVRKLERIPGWSWR